MTTLASRPDEELLLADLMAFHPSWKSSWVRNRLHLLANRGVVASRPEGKYLRYRLTETGKVLASRPEIRGLVYHGPHSDVPLTQNLVRIFGVALDVEPGPFWDTLLRSRLGLSPALWHRTYARLLTNKLLTQERILPVTHQTELHTRLYYRLTPTGVHLARLCTEDLPVEVFQPASRRFP